MYAYFALAFFLLGISAVSSQLGHGDYCRVGIALYGNGDTFQEGCTARCTCQNGSIGCVDLCPPGPSPPSHKKCQEVYAPGECCSIFACDQELTACKKLNITQTADPVPLARFPWTLAFRTSRSGQAYGAIFLSEKYILTYAPRLNASEPVSLLTKGDSFSPGNDVIMPEETFPIKTVLTHPKDSTSNGPVLQLVQLEYQLPYTKANQYANLPLDNDQCKALTNGPACPLDIVAIGAPLDGLMQIDVVGFKRNASECHLASGVQVVSTPRAEYVIGVTKTTTPVLCNPANLPSLSLCGDYLDWIKATIKA